MSTAETDIQKWSDHLCFLGERYESYLQSFDLEALNHELPGKRQIRDSNSSILLDIYMASTLLVDALEKAKKKDPNFIKKHLHFSNFGENIFSFEENLLVDIETFPEDGFFDIPIIKALDILSIKAIFEADIFLQAISSPRWNSFVFGHPTIRLITMCLFFLELYGSVDPVKQVDQLAFCVHNLIENEPCPPGWNDYVYQVRAWWRSEGRKIWEPVLSLPGGSGCELTPEDRQAYITSWESLLKDLRRRDMENDLGELGGASPDPKKLREAKRGQPLPKKCK